MNLFDVYEIIVVYSTGGSATYLASVIPEHLNVTESLNEESFNDIL